MIKEFSDRTRELRLNIALKTLEILTPSTAKWFNQTITNIHKVPRPFTKMLKATGKKNLSGIEIGFGKGINLTNLLQELPITSIYVIDPYINQAYKEGNMTVTQYQNKANINILTDWRVTRISTKSAEAANLFNPQSLDFVYIDGNHTYPYIKKDLELYTPLIKKDGYIGGHDYIPGQTGVIRAVQEHALNIKSIPTIDFPDFWFKVK